MEFKCGSKKCKAKRWWASSRVLEEDAWLTRGNMCYITVVFRLIHGFARAGILLESSSTPTLYFLTSLMSSVSSHCMVL